VPLEASVSRRDGDGSVHLELTLSNPTAHVALMAHVQLRRQRANSRVLPVWYSDNYVSLLPGERRVLVIEASAAELGHDRPLVTIDGWNVTTVWRMFPDHGGAAVAPNDAAIVSTRSFRP
jgi:hypothetical protein